MTSLHCSQKRDNVEYETPLELARDMIALCPLESGDVVLDPCRGETKVFYNNYPDFVTKEWCEILEGVDFFDFDKKVDWIITNPPYGKIFTPFLEKCLDVTEKGICLVVPMYALSRKRTEFLEAAGWKIGKMYLTRCWFGFPNVVLTLVKGEYDRAIKCEYKSPYKEYHNGKV